MAFIEMNYEGGNTTVLEIEQSYESGSTSSYTLTNLTVNKAYMLLIWSTFASSKSYTTYDTMTATNATLSKVGNLHQSNDTAAGTFFKLIPEQSSVTLSSSTAGRIILFTFS